jgi:hypothetical protein
MTMYYTAYSTNKVACSAAFNLIVLQVRHLHPTYIPNVGSFILHQLEVSISLVCRQSTSRASCL